MSNIMEKCLPFFSSFRGVRQGENIPCIICLILKNDLEYFLCDKSKYGCKDQESIHSSTTPDAGYQKVAMVITLRFNMTI